MESSNSQQVLLVKSSAATSVSELDEFGQEQLDFKTEEDKNLTKSIEMTINPFSISKSGNKNLPLPPKFFIGDASSAEELETLSSALTSPAHSDVFNCVHNNNNISSEEEIDLNNDECKCKSNNGFYQSGDISKSNSSTIIELDGNHCALKNQWNNRTENNATQPSSINNNIMNVCPKHSNNVNLLMDLAGSDHSKSNNQKDHNTIIDVPPMLMLTNNKDPLDNHGNLGASWQILIAVMTAASGNFAAGLILDKTKSWNVFRYTPELYYLVPILLSLKGNLEMTMVARLSTLANMGLLRSFKRIANILLYNISLVQTQAIVVSFLASIVTFIALQFEDQSETIEGPTLEMTQNLMNLSQTQLESILNEKGDGSAEIRKALLIFSTSLATANVACLVSTILMIMLTVALHHMNINPDNFVTALAASFGDIITSVLVELIGQFIYDNIVYIPAADKPFIEGIRYYDDLRTPVLPILIIIFFILIFPGLAYYTCQDLSTRKILLGLSAWIPILLSMLIAFVSGFVLRFGAVTFNFMSLFQPLINGVGGNLAAITTSRYSTELHVEEQKLLVNQNGSNSKSNKMNLSIVIKRTFNSFFVLNDSKNTMILIFILMAIIVHLFYGILAPMLHASDHHQVTPLFYFFYIPAAVFQILFLLIFTRFFVDIVWYLRYDPDTSAIPILTSMGDILGTVFLYVVFLLLRCLNDNSASPPIMLPVSSQLEEPNILLTNITELDLLNVTTTTIASISSPAALLTNNKTIRFITTPDNLTTFTFINYQSTTLANNISTTAASIIWN